MSLSIGTNNSAMRAAEAASISTRSMETSMERLSTGKRINSASDDAAGVAISSRLSAEIRGANQAIRNSLDGQALIDTAEGAHKEIENILQRMREVAVQASNDTNNAQDRGNLQTEMDAMIKEIDRIAATTTWAGTNLMADTAKSFEFQVGTATGAANQIKITIDGMSSAQLSLDGSKGIAASDFSFSTHTNTGGAAVDSLVLTKTDTDDATDVTDVFDLKHSASQATDVAATLTLFGDTVTLTGSAQGDQKLINDALGHHGVAAAIKTSYDTGTNAAIAGTENVAYLTLTVPEAGSGGKISVEATTTGGTDADTNARAAIDKIDTAIKDVNIQRSKLGAVSNRLNHTVNNLTNISSNLSAAKGGIEDADFALETTNLAKNQILQQASTAMLAQANASKQNVLSLLQG